MVQSFSRFRYFYVSNVNTLTKIAPIFVAFSKKLNFMKCCFLTPEKTNSFQMEENENLFFQQLHGICLNRTYNITQSMKLRHFHVKWELWKPYEIGQSQVFCKIKEMEKQAFALNCERANNVHFFFKLSFHHFPCTHPDQKCTTPNPLYVLHKTLNP